MYAIRSYYARSGPLSELCRHLDPLPLDGLLYLMARSTREEVRKGISLYLTRLKGTVIDISGADLQRFGLEPGPAYGEILRRVRAARIDGQAERREDQLALARARPEGVLPRHREGG